MNDQEKINLLEEALDTNYEVYTNLLKDYMEQKEMIERLTNSLSKALLPLDKYLSLRIDNCTDRDNVIIALANAGYTVSSHSKRKLCTSRYYVDIVEFPEELEEDS